MIGRQRVFCIHGQPLELAKRLDPRIRVIPLNYAYGKGDLADVPGTIEELAAMYLSQIKAIQPDGPYFLFGFSAGGTVAYEIANLLGSNGDAIGYVCLVEPTIGYATSMQRIGIIGGQMKEQGFNKNGLANVFWIVLRVLIRRPRVWMLKARTFFHQRTGVPMPLRLRWVNFLARLRPALRNYQYPKLDCNLEIYYGESDDATNMWREKFWAERIGIDCSLHTINRAHAHLDLMEDDALKKFAASLESAIHDSATRPDGVAG